MEIGWIALAIVGALVGMRVIQFFVVLVRLMRFPVSPLRITFSDVRPELEPHQTAFVTELEALGFEQLGWGSVEQGSRRGDIVYFRHQSEPAFAELNLLHAGSAGYPVAFFSFEPNERLLITINRIGWAMTAPGPHAGLVDAHADTLAAHWQAHLARIGSETATEVTGNEAIQRIADWSEGYFERYRQAGVIRPTGEVWHRTLKSATAAAWRWLRTSGKQARPYRSEAMAGENQSGFFTDCYLQMEAHERNRSARRDVKVWVLTLSITASLILWGLMFSWSQAVALVLILLVHEMGHALAMRAFGYRDMSMFFVPLLGAMVTGVAKELPTWKQTLVLLAGPMPGLLAGIAGLVYLNDNPSPAVPFDLNMVATMAVFINLFNLVPITPLDGGQLLEIALFSRWPRARLAFIVLSVVGFFTLAFWLSAVALFGLAVLLAGSLMTQWRIVRLQMIWRDGLSHQQQVTHLFDSARQLFRVPSFSRQYALVKAVFARNRIQRSRLWESAAVLVLLVGFWAGLGLFVYQPSAWRTAVAWMEDSRTPAQQAFDAAYFRYAEGEPDAPSLSALEQHAKALDPEDQRQVDLAVMRAGEASGAKRRTQMERILAQGRDGLDFPLKIVASDLLWDLYAENTATSSQQRAERLQTGIDRVMALAPSVYPGTIEARLWLAEMVDQGDEPERALAMLTKLRKHVGGADCHCDSRKVIRAQAWFYITHQRPGQALATLEASPYGARIRQSWEPLSLDYAWALLAAGRTKDGLRQMRLASYSEPFNPSLLQRIRGVRPRSAHLRHPLDLAYALAQAGQSERAHRIIQKGKWACWRIRNDSERPFVKPWQQYRETAIRKLVKPICTAVEREAKQRQLQCKSNAAG